MSRALSEQSAVRLQEILSKRFGRKLTEVELQTAYTNLMEFAYALIDLAPSKYPLEANNTLDSYKNYNVIC